MTQHFSKSGPLFVVPILAAASACDSGMCENTIHSQSTAPGGAHHAVVFDRACGATTGPSTQISIVAGAGPSTSATFPNDGGSVFVADMGNEDGPAAPWGGPLVSIKWETSSRLVVVYPQAARVFTEPAPVAGIDVVYVATAAPSASL